MTCSRGKMAVGAYESSVYRRCGSGVSARSLGSGQERWISERGVARRDVELGSETLEG